MGPLMISLL